VSNPLRDQLQAALADTYEIEQELGGGGMSRVFSATESALGRKVVIKVLPPELIEGLSVERFKREIGLAARLQHPHIVPVHTSGEIGGLPYFTMPFVDGLSLRARLAAGGALPITETIGIMRDVSKALAYAHDQGVVHRDIKPDNVLLSGGSAVVTDFGVAKALSASKAKGPGGTLTQVGTSLGTPSYMAPEQAAADPDTNHRADIYAFGVMSYEMLAGRPPFHGRTPQKLLAAHMGERPDRIETLRADVPPLLAQLVMQCLEKDPDQRPQSALEIVKILETVTSGGGHAALPAILIGGQRKLSAVLALYAAAFIAVAIVARAAIIALGLPDWVFPGAIIVMALGLPAILFTAFVHRGAHQALTQATHTPQGSPTQHGTMAKIAVKASPFVSWRRTFRGGAYALGTFAVVVTAFMIMRHYGIGPVASLLASGRIAERDQLLVTDFRGSGDSSLSAIVSEAIRTDLGQSSVIKIVPASAVADALGRMRRDRNSRVDVSLAREIAAREGIKGIVDGDVTPLAGGYVVAVRLVDASTGDGLASFRETIDGPDELLPTLNKLSRGLREKIGESLKKVRANPPLERVTTSSLEALRKYAEGLRAFDIEGDNIKAVGLFREATAIDTAFGMAYRKMGAAIGNAGLSPAARDSAYEAAFRHRSRMTDVERYLTEGSYYSSGSHADRGLSAKAYEALLRIDSLNGTAINNMARVLETRREYARAEQLLRRGIASRNVRATMYANFVSVLALQGKIAEADSAYAEARRAFPSNSLLRTLPPITLIALKSYDSAEKVAAHIIANDPEPSNRVAAAFSFREIAFVKGRGTEGLRRSESLNSMEDARGNPVSAVQRPIDSAWAEIWHLGEPGRAVQRLDAALARPDVRAIPITDRRLDDFAVLYAQAGRPDRARAVMATWEREATDTAYRRRSVPGTHIVRGAIAIAERRYAEAVREIRLSDALPDGPRNSCIACTLAPLARAFDAAGMADSAIAAYERYVNVISPFEWPDTYELAPAHERLGQLYEAKGNRRLANQHYAKFIELWKDAEPVLQPRVAKARARMAGG
jgi:tetratricopeptide (TPR) repeat protein